MTYARASGPRICSIADALTILGQKWALLILREISFGNSRFDDIAASTGAPRDILAARLKSLEAAGVILRELYQQKPPRSDYRLSQAGEELFGLLHVLRDWGDNHASQNKDGVARFHHSCGAVLKPMICCEACGEPLISESVIAEGAIRAD